MATNVGLLAADLFVSRSPAKGPPGTCVGMHSTYVSVHVRA